MHYRDSARPAEIVRTGPKFTFIERLIDSDKASYNLAAALLVGLKRFYVLFVFIAKAIVAISLFSVFAYLNYLLVYHFMSQTHLSDSDKIGLSFLAAIAPMCIEGYGIHLLLEKIREEMHHTLEAIRDKKRTYKEELEE